MKQHLSTNQSPVQQLIAMPSASRCEFHNFLFKCNFVLKRSFDDSEGSAAILMREKEKIWFTLQVMQRLLTFISAEPAKIPLSRSLQLFFSVEVSQNEEKIALNRKTVKRFW